MFNLTTICWPPPQLYCVKVDHAAGGLSVLHGRHRWRDRSEALSPPALLHRLPAVQACSLGTRLLPPVPADEVGEMGGGPQSDLHPVRSHVPAPKKQEGLNEHRLPRLLHEVLNL